MLAPATRSPLPAGPDLAPVAGVAHAPAWRDEDLAATLGPAFAWPQPPEPLPAPHWVAVNQDLAAELGLLDWIDTPGALQLLAGNAQPPRGTRASAYSGHQFGVWAGQLGDGRALLLGELESAAGPVEVQLKGSGRTPFSRMGDGRAVLRSSIREYLGSEAMHALGIPTTRALAIVGSPAPVRRETVETAAVVTRTAPSFLRFGHFEYLAHTAPDAEAQRRLAEACIERHYPDLAGAPQAHVALLQAVTLRTADLLAQWQAVGFCHGVMNTDNMSMAGLTLDYGPFGFLDAFDPGHVCNHSDMQGRYAYARQPGVALWNLHALAQALLPLIGDAEAARAALRTYAPAYERALLDRMRAKLGLRDAHDGDRELVDDLLRLMASDHADFTLTFRRLCDLDSGPGAANGPMRDLFIDREACDGWMARYVQRLRAENSLDAERAARMKRVNPRIVLRNHLAEGAIRRALEGDFGEVGRLQQALSRPFDEGPPDDPDAAFPPPWAAQLEVSCSS